MRVMLVMQEPFQSLLKNSHEMDLSDEEESTLQIKELAYESLQLLETAIFDKECEPIILP